MFNPSAFRPRKQNSHRADATKRCPGYLQWLRGRPCFLSIHANGAEHVCSGKVRACHYDPWGDKGMGTKVSDAACLPGCDGFHAEQTDRIGWPGVERKYDFDGRDVVTRYFLQWRDGTPMGQAWQAKQGDADEPSRPVPSVRKIGGPR